MRAEGASANPQVHSRGNQSGWIAHGGIPRLQSCGGGQIYTTDIAAGEGAETVLASEGYGDSVTFVNGFDFIEDLLSSKK